MHRTLRRLAALFAVIALFTSGSTFAAGDKSPVTIFAAASTTDAVNEIAEAYAKATGGSLRPVVAASSTLARQIAQGAPADIYLSADVEWMDDLDRRGLLMQGTRLPLLSNRLVLIAPKDSTLRLKLSSDPPLRALLGDGRLAVGDPAHVPAGIYAREALQKLGLWDQVKDRLAQAANVRAALALVDRGEVAAGIVYDTDAAISSRVKVIDVFPASATPEITYPLAIIAGHDSPAVRQAYDFITGQTARAIFEKYGFTRPHAGS